MFLLQESPTNGALLELLLEVSAGITYGCSQYCISRTAHFTNMMCKLGLGTQFSCIFTYV
jgi:hypothetical protein